MGHLRQTRRGWENERLASFLLSKIAFVAQPLSIADDAGSDFFCTMFKVRQKGKHEELSPIQSFAIQIKSSKRAVFAKDIDYYLTLDLPYFIGIVQDNELALDIYSAENLPMALALHGDGRDSTSSKEPFVVRFDPIGGHKEKRVEITRESYSSIGRTRSKPTLMLKCPFIVRLTVQNFREVSDKLVNICTRAIGNISSRRTDHHCYEFMGEEEPLIYAGGGSYEHFRANFYKRLTEVFGNLRWVKERGGPERPPSNEAALYIRIYRLLANDNAITLPPYLQNSFEKTKKVYDR